MVSAGTAEAPLAGLRVFDLTRFVSGSYATLTLAALGAEVLKIEVPPDGDPYRVQGTARLEGESVLFLTLNSGKQSVALDFRAPKAKEAVERLLASSDILVENSRPGSLTRYGLDSESVLARHPHLIYGSISGFGDVGPEATRGGFDLILQAASGLMSVTGHPQSGPAKVGAPVTDVGAGLACVAGVLAALVERARTGRGRHVSTSLLEFSLSTLSTVATEAFTTGVMPGLLGTHSPTFAPYGSFRAADGWVAVAGAGSEELFRRCCRVLGLEALIADERFVDNASRVRHRGELTRLIEAVTITQPVDHWLARLSEAGVPAARINDVSTAFAEDQVEALGVIQQLEHSRVGSYRTVGVPLRLDGHRFPPPLPAPRLGEHTRRVLVGVDLEDLIDAGVALDGS